MPITRRGATGPLLVPLPGRMHVVAASDVAVIAALCLWALILRLPFFFPDTIDWDESTLIIMGQGIRDGLLPYDRIWDSKLRSPTRRMPAPSSSWAARSSRFEWSDISASS